MSKGSRAGRGQSGDIKADIAAMESDIKKLRESNLKYKAIFDNSRYGINLATGALGY